jgi:hypothetical protein
MAFQVQARKAGIPNLVTKGLMAYRFHFKPYEKVTQSALNKGWQRKRHYGKRFLFFLYER